MKFTKNKIFFLIAILGSIIDIISKNLVFKALQASIFIPVFLFSFENTSNDPVDWQMIENEFQKQSIDISSSSMLSFTNLPSEKWITSDKQWYLIKQQNNKYSVYTSKNIIPSSEQLRSPYLFVHPNVSDITIIPKCFNFRIAFNLGAVWSSFQGQFMLLTGLSIFAILFILFLIGKKSYSVLYQIAIGGICAGAIGNLWDRLIYGGVRDFLDCYINTAHWPTYNIADSMIVVGIILYCFLEIKNSKNQKTQTEKNNA